MRNPAVLTRNDGSKMNDARLGIDVSKATLDADYASDQRKQARKFANDPDGWRQMLCWLKAMDGEQAHVCMEATGRHSLGVALALHDAGHVVSIVNPAQIRDFARTKLGRNKTDKVDAALIREYVELFEPAPWAPPSPAVRRLSELQSVRAGLIGSRAEWTNRIGSGLGDDTALKLAAATIAHFTAQLEAVDKAIAATIDEDAALRSRRELLLSVGGVGETLAALLLAELPSRECCAGAARWLPMLASTRATTDPANRSTVRPGYRRSAMLCCGRHSTCRRLRRCALIPRSRPSRCGSRARAD